MKYQLQLSAEALAQLVVKWQSRIQLIPVGDNTPESWGPTLQELRQIRYYEFHESTAADDEGSDEEWRDFEESEDEDADFLEAIEVSALADEYRDDERLNGEISSWRLSRKRTASPYKQF